MTNYIPLPFIKGQHIETLIPGLLRRVNYNSAEAIKINTHDGDFLELDLYRRSKEDIIILSHGLEGNSTRAYMKGMTRIFHKAGFTVLGWNYRGCGPNLNKTARLYHSGATDDLSTVVNYTIDQGYKRIFLIGFSLGGNLTLKYVGEDSLSLPNEIKGAIAFSAPVNLSASGKRLAESDNRIYTDRFLRKLKKKVRLKNSQYPEAIKLEHLNSIHDLKTFDDHYTAPIHGFKDADDYYDKSSSNQFLKSIRIPTLLVNALNDPFLPSECYPYDEAKANDFFSFEAPEHGGHVGFMQLNRQGYYWSEERALSFVKETFE